MSSLKHPNVLLVRLSLSFSLSFFSLVSPLILSLVFPLIFSLVFPLIFPLIFSLLTFLDFLERCVFPRKAFPVLGARIRSCCVLILCALFLRSTQFLGCHFQHSSFGHSRCFGQFCSCCVLSLRSCRFGPQFLGCHFQHPCFIMVMELIEGPNGKVNHAILDPNTPH